MTDIEKAIILLVENGYRVERTKLADDMIATKGLSLTGPQVELLARSIEDLGISIRAKNCLITENIKTVLDLVGYNRSELLKVPNLGYTSLNNIIERLNEHGLSLKVEKETEK